MASEMVRKLEQGFRRKLASFPGLPTVQVLIACKTGQWKGLGTRFEVQVKLQLASFINKTHF